MATDADPQKNNLKMTKFELLTLVIAFLAIGSSILGIWYNHSIEVNTIKEQQNNTQQNIARAIYFDIKTLEDRFSANLNNINKTAKDVVVYDTYPYYYSGGLYHVFSRDIANFEEPGLSSDLYDFYSRVLKIEEDRNHLQQIHDNFFNVDGEINVSPNLINEIKITNSVMYTNMILAKKDAEKISKELKSSYNFSDPIQINKSGVSYPFRTYYVRNISLREIFI